MAVDVGAWLCGLGLEQYERAFRDDDVDVEVLTELTADDLIGLSVRSIGHRRKLLAAIAAQQDQWALVATPESRDAIERYVEWRYRGDDASGLPSGS